MQHRNLSLQDTVQPHWRIGIVASYYYTEEMEQLVAGARETLEQAGIPAAHITVHKAAGSWEVPLVGAALAEQKQVDAVIGLGIIIEGETHHARLLAERAAQGIMDTQLKYLLPFAFEILYVDSLNLVRARLDKGKEAATSVLHSLAVLDAIRSE